MYIVFLTDFMKSIVFSCGGALLLGLTSCLALTNPGQSDYEEYASKKLVFYVKSEVCSNHRVSMFLNRYCQTLVDSSRIQLGHFLSQATQRQNFLLFSIYKTEIFLPGILPRYEVDTLGIMDKFYTYNSD